jgi:hypothetical protein
MAGAFSPNLNHSPEPVDFPLDSLGNWIDSVWNRWSVHDPAFLARNITEGSDLTIFFDCGIYDEYNLYPFNVAFADSLYKLGLPYVFQSYNGNHSNQLLNRFNTAFRFLDTIMNRTVRVSDNYVIQPESFSLLQNYPNPFNPTTKINWRSPVSSRQTLKVYDVLGNEVVTLVDEYKPAGSYEVDFKASNLPSGVYFYQLKAGKYVETKKAILMR